MHSSDSGGFAAFISRRPCERTSGCTHLENRLKYRDLDDPRFWTRLYVGRSATVDKTQVFRTRRSTRKRWVHPLVRSQGRRERGSVAHHDRNSLVYCVSCRRLARSARKVALPRSSSEASRARIAVEATAASR